MTSSRLEEIEALLVRLWTDQAFALEPSEANLDDCNLPEFAQAKLDKQRLALYSDVLRLNHLQTLQAIYPRSAKVIGKNWQRVALAYFRRLPDLIRQNQARNFLINNTGAYFHEFFQAQETSLIESCPYLPNLIDFEWKHAGLTESSQDIPTNPPNKLTSTSNLAEEVPVLNPVMQLLRYKFDIPELINAIDDCDEDCKPQVEPKDSLLLAVRNPNTHRVRVVELNEITALVIETAAQGNCTYQDLISVAADHCLIPKDQLTRHCLDLFSNLMDHHAIVASKSRH